MHHACPHVSEYTVRVTTTAVGTPRQWRSHKSEQKKNTSYISLLILPKTKKKCITKHLFRCSCSFKIKQGLQLPQLISTNSLSLSWLLAELYSGDCRSQYSPVFPTHSNQVRSDKWDAASPRPIPRHSAPGCHVYITANRDRANNHPWLLQRRMPIAPFSPPQWTKARCRWALVGFYCSV